MSHVIHSVNLYHLAIIPVSIRVQASSNVAGGDATGSLC